MNLVVNGRPSGLDTKYFKELSSIWMWESRQVQLNTEFYDKLDEETIASIQNRYADVINSRIICLSGARWRGRLSINYSVNERIPDLGELLTDDIKGIIRGYYSTYFLSSI